MTPAGTRAASLAASAPDGGLALVLVLLLFVVAAGLFLAMSSSLKRMRGNVSKGTFGAPGPDGRGGDRRTGD